jgi:hypothetical protein
MYCWSAGAGAAELTVQDTWVLCMQCAAARTAVAACGLPCHPLSLGAPCRHPPTPRPSPRPPSSSRRSKMASQTFHDFHQGFSSPCTAYGDSMPGGGGVPGSPHSTASELPRPGGRGGVPGWA